MEASYRRSATTNIKNWLNSPDTLAKIAPLGSEKEQAFLSAVCSLGYNNNKKQEKDAKTTYNFTINPEGETLVQALNKRLFCS